MAPKKKKAPRKERFRCDEVEGERFHAPNEDVFRFNWWEVFCFPYILCARVWDCCVALCSGTNQCLVYWMMIQWIVCKITKLTTPDPIIFPYYFYLFCQVILLTLFFVLLWQYFGKSIFIPFFTSIYTVMAEDESDVLNSTQPNVTRLAFRRYCFRKGEIFDTSFKNKSVGQKNNPVFNVVFMMLDVFVHDLLYH